MFFHGRNQYVVSNSQGEPVWPANGVHHHRSCLQLSRIFVFAGEKDLTAWREFERALSAHVKGRGAGFPGTHSVARKNRDFGDRVRTGESGSATFNMSGQGSLK